MTEALRRPLLLLVSVNVSLSELSSFATAIAALEAKGDLERTDVSVLSCSCIALAVQSQAKLNMERLRTECANTRS